MRSHCEIAPSVMPSFSASAVRVPAASMAFCKPGSMCFSIVPQISDAKHDCQATLNRKTDSRAYRAGMALLIDQRAIGGRIRAARKRAGMTQDQLAAKFDITKSAVSQWESGSTMPDIRPIIALCQATSDNSADEILLGAASVRVTLAEKQLLQLIRELPLAFQVALSEHINKQWELAHPERVGPGAPFAKVRSPQP